MISDMKLEYSKDWRNPADFPTIETDEAKVRADMQLLYTEIQTFLNNVLIPAMKQLENPTVETLPVESEVSGSNEKIPTSAAVSKLFASKGNLPAGGMAGQFLVKLSNDYGHAGWATFSIPGRLSDLIATDLGGTPVNAQALLTEIMKKVYGEEAN